MSKSKLSLTAFFSFPFEREGSCVGLGLLLIPRLSLYLSPGRATVGVLFFFPRLSLELDRVSKDWFVVEEEDLESPTLAIEEEWIDRSEDAV